MRLDSSLLVWLRCFEATARHKSFSQAAAELFITQGAVSQQIRQLEIRLRRKLFERRGGRTALTRDGLQLQSQIAPAIRKIEQAVSELQGQGSPLHVSCSPSFAMKWLMPRLGEFHRRHPGIDLRLRAEFHALKAANFVRDGLDVAIRYDPFEYEELESEVLMLEYLVPVVCGVPDTRKPALALSNLRTATLLHDGAAWDGAGESVEWKAYLDARGADASLSRKGRFFNLSDFAIAAAIAGEGIAMARLALVLEDIEAKRLHVVDRQPVVAPGRYVLLTNGEVDKRTNLFAAWLREQCSQFQKRCDFFIADLTGKVGRRSPR